MQYLQWAVLAFSVLALMCLVGAVVLLRMQRFPARVINTSCMVLSLVTASLLVIVGLPWPALPWVLTALVWMYAAVRYS
jgi:hypothetical protein